MKADGNFVADLRLCPNWMYQWSENGMQSSIDTGVAVSDAKSDAQALAAWGAEHISPLIQSFSFTSDQLNGSIDCEQWPQVKAEPVFELDVAIGEASDAAKELGAHTRKLAAQVEALQATCAAQGKRLALISEVAEDASLSDKQVAQKVRQLMSGRLKNGS